MELNWTPIPSPGGYTVPPPARQSAEAAGADLRACLDGPVTIEAGALVRIPSGVALAIPPGYAGFVFARSGLGVKHGITLSNGVGVIDADYRGEVTVGLVNLSRVPFTIEPGMRIAQLVIMRAEQLRFVVGAIGETARGAGGFGSTGTQ